MKILVTGGMGYIGSHTVLELLKEGYEVIVVDNLVNSNIDVKEKIEKLSGKTFEFIKVDVRDKSVLEEIFKNNKIDSVIHFAGLKAVGESVKKPIEYYDNNIGSTIVLLNIMKKYNCKKIVFSSSATVYGKPKELPVKEYMEVGGTTNPYGTSKLIIEQILKDLYISDNTWEISILRYFNPIGSEISGTLGENPKGIPNNLMPYIVRVASGELEELSIFGNDYHTIDGTGVRDYIHVVDLAKGHIKAIEKIKKGVNIYNLGTGKGTSVLELVNTFEKVTGKKIKYRIVERREGDIAEYYADPTKAKEELGWIAEYDIEDMCRDAYRFIENIEN